MLSRTARYTLKRNPYTRSFSDSTPIPSRPLVKRGTGVTAEERAVLRSDRKLQAAKVLQQHGVKGAEGATTSQVNIKPLVGSRIFWYLGLGVPTAIITWGFLDENSPPAKLSKFIGLTTLIKNYTDEVAKPKDEKLLIGWEDLPNVPRDIPTPHTLVLDLENTLVSSTWDRKHGWRHAKRPGIDKFLLEMAQYYEIVLFSPSSEGVAQDVVKHLDKSGCIMHQLFRDSTYYVNGVHVKDLSRLNRPLNRIVVLDDDPAEVQFHPENLIRVKPYKDPTDRNDRTLERLIPFLKAIARDDCNDVPGLLAEFEGLDSDGIADEYERRLREFARSQSQQGLGSIARRNAAPIPQYNDSPQPKQLTAKDIVGGTTQSVLPDVGLSGWMKRREKEKEEMQMRKIEKWNEVMMKKR